jgi:hypothetical protein
VAPKDRHGPQRALADSSRGRKNRYRASLFRNRGESRKNIHIVETDGMHSTIHQAGYLNTVTHKSVLLALEYWANRFCNKGKMSEREDHSHSWVLDKTGTINTSLLNHGEILQQEQISIRGVSDDVLQVHGVLPGRKEKGITRFFMKTLMESQTGWEVITS